MKLFDYYFYLYILALFFVKVCRFYSIDIGYFNFYLTDFFAVPAMTHLGSYIISKLKYNGQLYIYPTSYLIITALVLSILLEVIMPKISTDYTADIFDSISYFAGILFYLKLHKPYILRLNKKGLNLI